MDYQEPCKSMYLQGIKLDDGKVEETRKTEEDTAKEAFEPGGGVAEVTHALYYKIQDQIPSVTMEAKKGNGTSGVRGEDGLRDLHNDEGLKSIGIGQRTCI